MRFSSRLHDERTATVLGRWLFVAFVTCFATGLLSHLFQHQPAWLVLPARPVWGYRVTQGIHVAAGIAAIPLLLAKLWTVYPKLFAWPPVRSPSHAVERASLIGLVGGATLELVTGLINTTQWYPWRFSFVPVHYWLGWVTIGALLVHVGVKAPKIAAAWRRRPEPPREGLSRRGFLTATAVAAGAVTVTTAGQTVPWLSTVDLLAPRRPDVGPQGLPVNRTAAQAAVRDRALDPAYRLEVAGPRPFTLTLAELRALEQHDAVLPIACVEGWSATARWTGVRVRDLLVRAGAPPGARARVVSLEPAGPYRESVLDRAHAWDELTLLALAIGGEPLDVEHGYPARLIAPNRPGVLQTKWVGRLEVLR